jgi:hypothetical protein
VIKIKIEIEVQYCSSHRCDVFDFISFKCCLYLNISCLLLTTNVTAVYSIIHWLIACFLTPLHFPLPSSSLPSPPSLLLSPLSSIPPLSPLLHPYFFPSPQPTENTDLSPRDPNDPAGSGVTPATSRFMRPMSAQPRRKASFSNLAVIPEVSTVCSPNSYQHIGNSKFAPVVCGSDRLCVRYVFQCREFWLFLEVFHI